MENTISAKKSIDAALPVLQRINELYMMACSLEEEYTARREKRANACKKATVVAGIALWVLIYGLVNSFYKAQLSAGNVSGVGPAFIGIAIVCVCCAALMKFVVSPLLGKTIGGASVAMQDMEEQADAISQEIYNTYIANQETLDPLPRDYRYYDAAVFFESALANGRAESMKEAVNLYEEYLHRVRMEANGQQMLAMQQQQSQMLAYIERNSGVTATFSVLNYLHKIM